MVVTTIISTIKFMYLLFIMSKSTLCYGTCLRKVCPCLASAVGVRSQVPKPSSFKVQDLFHSLGPLPFFSGDNRWNPKREVIIAKQKQKGMGISLRKSCPVIISGVEDGGAAEVMYYHAQ